MPEDFNKQFRGMVWDSAKKVAGDTMREAPGDFVRDMKKVGGAVSGGVKKSVEDIGNSAKGIARLGGAMRERLFNYLK
jgi:hypothetical protein